MAVFNGKIMVHLDAQKTNAYQRNQNILLSNEAKLLFYLFESLNLLSFC